MNSIPTRKGIRIQKEKPKRVCRSIDSCPRSTKRSTGPKPRAACFQSVDRAVDRSLPRWTGWSTGLFLCISCRPVDRTQTESSLLSWLTVRSTAPCHGRPGGRSGYSCACRVFRSTDFLHRSAVRSTGSIFWPAAMHRSLPLSSGLCAVFLYLIYLLSPYTY